MKYQGALSTAGDTAYLYMLFILAPCRLYFEAGTAVHCRTLCMLQQGCTLGRYCRLL